MLKFKSMDFENFGSFEGLHTFEFADKGIHLITAQNLDPEGDSSFTGRHSVGSGKCLHEDTEVNIEILDEQCLKDFKKFF